jgi:hypothetical protein
LVKLKMMDITQRHHIFIADLSRHGLGLGEAQMVGLGWSAIANKTMLARHITQMFL